MIRAVSLRPKLFALVGAPGLLAIAFMDLHLQRGFSDATLNRQIAANSDCVIAVSTMVRASQTMAANFTRGLLIMEVPVVFPAGFLVILAIKLLRAILRSVQTFSDSLGDMSRGEGDLRFRHNHEGVR